MSIKKIFVIGFNKTGTYSFHTLFNYVGLNSVHSRVPILDIIDEYDAFCDGDLNFIEFYNKYPNSLFILNTRPIKNWLVSRYKHGLDHKWEDCWCWPVNDEKTNFWIEQRETYFNSIFDFFKDKKDQLLIVNIEKKGWENVVLNFIQKPNLDLTFKENTRGESLIGESKMILINNSVNICLSNLNYNGNELLFKEEVDLEKYNYYL
jgi:hypothetical protein